MKIKVTSFAMDSFLSVIKATITCSCKVGDDECEEDYMFFMPLEPKPAPARLGTFIIECKTDAGNWFASKIENTYADLEAAAAPEAPATPIGTVPEGVVTEPVITPEPAVEPEPVATLIEVIEAKAKSKARAKPKAKDVIDVAHIETPVATESLPVTYIDVMFDRSNKSMLVEIVDSIAALKPDWKSDPAMLASIKDALNAANGHWIYSRNGKVNQALVVAVADTSLTLGANKLPNPFFS